MRQSKERRALKQFTLSTGKSAGRNYSGRITVFHRGGGSKRLLRRIDLKRSTSSMGIVERIEYDPNRSSQIIQILGLILRIFCISMLLLFLTRLLADWEITWAWAIPFFIFAIGSFLL